MDKLQAYRYEKSTGQYVICKITTIFAVQCA